MRDSPKAAVLACSAGDRLPGPTPCEGRASAWGRRRPPRLTSSRKV